MVWNSIKKSVHFLKNIYVSIVKMTEINPPITVQGMTVLDKHAFKKIITVPWIQVESLKMGKMKKSIRKYLLKLENFKNVDTLEGSMPECKRVFLNPVKIKKFEDFAELDRTYLENIGYTQADLKFTDLEISYENWRADELLRAILPSDQDSLASYSRIGHIVHVNLHEHLIPFKSIIGQIMIEKIKGAKTVVNKTDNIDNTYRNFEMEVLSGDPDLKASVKENHCLFELDFGRVYWNPRLCTEHERIINLIQKGDVLYDVFAGIGPFSIPAAKRGAFVLANDLNPESYHWLTHNAKLNKIPENVFKSFNKDGRDFIREEVRDDLTKRWKSGFAKSIHISMNLPAIATTFLDAFRDLLPKSLTDLKGVLPNIHVYCFAKDESSEDLALNLVETGLGSKLDKGTTQVKFVRKVSPSKNMMRVSFILPVQILLQEEATGEPPTKKFCPEGEACL